jgi:RNA polymerase sigma-70 factor (ECF subfamily)
VPDGPSGPQQADKVRRATHAPRSRTITVPQLERIFRDEHARAIGALVRSFGDIDLAEEMVQEAFLTATDRWPTTGIPPNPGAWITTTARNRAIDRLRREAKRDGHQQHRRSSSMSTNRTSRWWPTVLSTTTAYASSSPAATHPWPSTRRSP